MKDFPPWRVLFVRREGNAVAHHLAQLIVSNYIFRVSVESFSNSVHDFVSLDKWELSPV
jgi:hypothetical protein